MPFGEAIRALLTPGKGKQRKPPTSAELEARHQRFETLLEDAERQVQQLIAKRPEAILASDDAARALEREIQEAEWDVTRVISARGTLERQIAEVKEREETERLAGFAAQAQETRGRIDAGLERYDELAGELSAVLLQMRTDVAELQRLQRELRGGGPGAPTPPGMAPGVTSVLEDVLLPSRSHDGYPRLWPTPEPVNPRRANAAPPPPPFDEGEHVTVQDVREPYPRQMIYRNGQLVESDRSIPNVRRVVDAGLSR